MLVLLIVGGLGGLQWHNVHTKVCENQLAGLKVGREAQKYHDDHILVVFANG
jgi:hypothetical protein